MQLVTYVRDWTQVLFILHIWQGYLTFSYYIVFDRIVCVLVTFKQWGHFMMLIIRKLNLISVQSSTWYVRSFLLKQARKLMCDLIHSVNRCFLYLFDIRYRPVPFYTSATSKEGFKAAAIFEEMEKMLKGVGNRMFWKLLNVAIHGSFTV